MRYTICILVFLGCAFTSAYAQHYPLKINAKVNANPNFKINSVTNGGSSQGLGLLFSNLNKYPVEFGLVMQRGYNSSVQFSFGLTLAYVLVGFNNNWLKTGLEVSRFHLKKYRYEDDMVGDVMEDDRPTSFKPYLEWEWGIGQSFSLFIHSGYRLTLSQTKTITEILSRNADGTVQRFRTKEETNFYSSGFEGGIGINIKLY
ncbi:hypothetical protein [Fodinibius halophilus]|uniref:Outer membrane protein beta-barrel domain-containing protein n=1 Tax=Fodinibius halophilus TaxID=1736908 RepID=A0A6M1T8F1_9BACT|nr:hypothetical protein [Fodinibius halophilus]NGP88291.1 hypothetical protein [Fodinibius halophilus]